MITVILLIVMIGITVVCGVIAAADIISPWLEPRMAKMGRRIKRELLARWLTEYGLTVRPLTETETALLPVRTGDADEFLRLISEM